MDSLQQLLAKNSSSTSGIHEAMASHAEDVFESFKGILPIFLGKRELGPFVALTLPRETTQSQVKLLSAISDLILAYNFRVVSFLSAIQVRTCENDLPKLGAILITADAAKTLFQLPWDMQFDRESNLTEFKRTEADGEVIPSESWNAFFQRGGDTKSRRMGYDRLIPLFEDKTQLPAFEK